MRHVQAILVFALISVGLTQNNLACAFQHESTVSFSDLTNPVIGFTETTTFNGKVYAGWYIVEAEATSLLPFKAFFFSTVYVDGLEIGKRYETPRELWEEKEFMDYPNMLKAYEDLSKHAPICIN